jgi:hypothetical protein
MAVSALLSGYLICFHHFHCGKQDALVARSFKTTGARVS